VVFPPPLFPNKPPMMEEPSIAAPRPIAIYFSLSLNESETLPGSGLSRISAYPAEKTRRGR
jgi:hypothetical protein